MNAYRPLINQSGILTSIAASILSWEKAVPVNIELGKSFDILVITGPNMAARP